MTIKKIGVLFLILILGISLVHSGTVIVNTILKANQIRASSYCDENGENCMNLPLTVSNEGTSGSCMKIYSAKAVSTTSYSEAVASIWTDVNGVVISENISGMTFVNFKTQILSSAPTVAAKAYFRLMVDDVVVDVGDAYAASTNVQNGDINLVWVGDFDPGVHEIKVQVSKHTAESTISKTGEGILSVISEGNCVFS